MRFGNPGEFPTRGRVARAGIPWIPAIEVLAGLDMGTLVVGANRLADFDALMRVRSVIRSGTIVRNE